MDTIPTVYYRLHLPTGKLDTCDFPARRMNVEYYRPLYRAERLEMLNSWNRTGKGQWLYWMD